MAKKEDRLGNLEQLMLTAVVALEDSAYGLAIRDKATELGGYKVNIGSVYVTLERLEAKGYLKSRLTPPSPDEGGNARRYYAIKPAGLEVLREATEASKRLISVLRIILGWK